MQEQHSRLPQEVEHTTLKLVEANKNMDDVTTSNDNLKDVKLPDQSLEGLEVQELPSNSNIEEKQ